MVKKFRELDRSPIPINLVRQNQQMTLHYKSVTFSLFLESQNREGINFINILAQIFRMKVLNAALF